MSLWETLASAGPTEARLATLGQVERVEVRSEGTARQLTAMSCAGLAK